MKYLWIVLIPMLVMAGSLHAQTIIKKSPGDPTTVDWKYDITAEPVISGFRIYVAPAQAGPFTFSGTSTAANLRTVTFPTTFSTNSVRLFFQVKAYKTAGTDTVESTGTPGDKEVELFVVSPTAVLVK